MYFLYNANYDCSQRRVTVVSYINVFFPQSYINVMQQANYNISNGPILLIVGDPERLCFEDSSDNYDALSNTLDAQVGCVSH